MKKRLMIIAMLFLATGHMVKAEDKVTISDFKISAGETKEVSIALNNDVAYVAFQFDLYLPEGITVESFSADHSRLPESTTLDMSQQPDGSYRFLSAAMGGEPMTGNNGNIVTLTVKASEGLTLGERTGYFRKVKLSKADATGPTCNEMSFQIAVIFNGVAVSLDKSEVAVEKGKTTTLKATVSSELEDKSVTWKSSKTSVAIVTNKGVVTGVGGGIATITCTSVATGQIATCKVTVGKVSLGKSEVAVEKGKTVTLTATVYPSTLEDRSVTWKSSKTSVATVTSDGKVTGVGGGTATITGTSVATGFTATCKVTVGKVSLGKSEVFVEKGKTTTLTGTVYPSTLEDRSVTWKSSKTSVATVTSKGVVKGVGGGTATITCTSVATGFTATCMVTVGKVSLSKSEVFVEKGKTTTLTGTVYPSTLEDKSVTWMSSNTAVATVTSKGVVKGIAGGTATITCTSVATGFTATCKVTVGKVSLNKYEVAVEKGKTVMLTATVYPSSLSDRSVTWKSSSTSVATVSSDGKVTGVGGGTATITCTSVATGFTATCQVTVGKVSLSKYELTVEKGKTTTLTATVYPSSLEDRSVTWKSSNTAVATVTSDGKVKGVTGGTATITCTSVATGFTATCQVTVTESASARTLDGDDEEVTGIETIEETPVVEEPYDVYDLKGRKVLQRVTSLDGLPAGIYIVNGKKILKK